MTWVPTISTSEIEEEEVVAAVADGVRVAIYRFQDQFFATDNICSHGHARLSDGYLEEFTIECPLHQGTFDIRTGEPTSAPCTIPIRAFPVRIDDGVIHIKVEKET